MGKFDTVFPQFAYSCAKLYQAMVPWSLAVLVLSFAFEFWRGIVDFQAIARFLTKLFFIVLLTGQANQLINSGQEVVEKLVLTSGLVRPETLASDFKKRLAETTGEADLKQKSAARLLFSGRLLDAILYAFLVVVSFICLGIVTFIIFVQKMALLICWACCPILFALIAIPPVAHLGSAHIMRILAILCWPLGFAVAATFSDGLLNTILQDRMLAAETKNLGAAIESLLLLAVVGLWSIASTIFAPAFIQRFLVGHAGSARVLSISGALGLGMIAPKLAVTAFNSIRSHLPSFRSVSGPSSPGVPPMSPPSSPPAEGSPPPAAIAGALSSPSDPTGTRRLLELLGDN